MNESAGIARSIADDYRAAVGEAQTVWERVDLPVLKFVAELDYGLRWQFSRGEPTEEIPALKGEELDAALSRLEGYGLIAAGSRSEKSAISSGRDFVRPQTAGGCSASGRPPARRTFLRVLVEVLKGLAGSAPEAEAKALQRAAGSIGRLASGVVFDTAKGLAGEAGEELAT